MDITIYYIARQEYHKRGSHGKLQVMYKICNLHHKLLPRLQALLDELTMKDDRNARPILLKKKWKTTADGMLNSTIGIAPKMDGSRRKDFKFSNILRSERVKSQR
jgi:hypothetical protein